MESVRFAPWVSSLGIHLLLLAFFLMFHWRVPVRPWGSHRSGDPTLIEIAEMPGTLFSSRHPMTQKTSVSTRRLNSAGVEIAEARDSYRGPTQSTPEGFGSTDGDSASGELGSIDGVKLNERDRYLSDLRTVLEAQKKYPSLSRRMRETGRVWIRFQMGRDGQFSDISVLKSSGYGRLDAAALALVQGVGRYRAFPVAMAEPSIFVEIPVDYVMD